MALAFFDLDGTVISVNSASLWIRREYELGRIGASRLVEAALWFSLYRVGLTRMESALHRAAATLKGASEEQLAQETRQFWEERVKVSIRHGARRAVDRHRRRGDRIVLLTSSSPYISAPAVEDLGMDDFVCTRFQVHGGRLTGRILLPICYGPGKLQRARAYADQLDEDLGEATFYTDSMADRQVLEAVGHPVCVSPDPRLARLARRSGWLVQGW